VLARAVTAAVAVGAVVVFMFVGALHSPEPNDVPITIAGPDQVTAAVGERIDAAAPGGFDIEYAEDPEAAKREVLEQEAMAVLVPGEPESRLYVAGANGGLSKNILSSAFTRATEANGGALAVEDLAPLPDGDRAGLAPFLLTMATLLPSLVLAIAIAVGAGRLASPRARFAAALLGTGVLALVNAIAADPVLGALEGSFWGVFGVVWLLSFSVAGVALALHRLAGIPGLGLAFLMFLVIGMPVSGAAVGPHFVPEGFQAFTLAFPAGETVPLLRKIVYFEDAPIGLELGLLLAWAAFAAVVLLAPGRLRRSTVPDHDVAPATA
jgi:hypothetical protein